MEHGHSEIESTPETPLSARERLLASVGTAVAALFLLSLPVALVLSYIGYFTGHGDRWGKIAGGGVAGLAAAIIIAGIALARRRAPGN